MRFALMMPLLAALLAACGGGEEPVRVAQSPELLPLTSQIEPALRGVTFVFSDGVKAFQTQGVTSVSLGPGASFEVKQSGLSGGYASGALGYRPCRFSAENSSFHSWASSVLREGSNLAVAPCLLELDTADLVLDAPPQMRKVRLVLGPATTGGNLYSEPVQMAVGLYQEGLSLNGFTVGTSASTLPGMPGASLGSLRVFSSLGEPLRAEIHLNRVSEDEDGGLWANVASPADFERANIEYTSILATMRFEVEWRSDGYVIRVQSIQPANEPFIDVLIELNAANYKLVREYTFLLNPADLHIPAADISPGP